MSNVTLMVGSIGNRIIAVVALVVILGLTSLTFFYIHHQQQAIHDQNQSTILKLTESVSQSLQTIMVAGYADIARTFADNLKRVPDVTDFRILRIDGSEAFRDNATINAVNSRLDEIMFLPHENVQLVPILPPNHRELREAIRTGRMVHYQETGAEGEQYLTVLVPMSNQEECHRCHGSGQSVRGILKLTTNLSPIYAEVRNTELQAIVVLITSVLAIILVAWFILRKSIVSPIHDVTRAMMRAAKGDLDMQVPVNGRDEIAVMAQSFNRMTRELLATYSGLQEEQDKLTTIILSAREGIVVTDGDGTIVLVNPAAENLLGKSRESIIADGFLNLLGDAQQMHEWLDNGQQNASDPHVIGFRDQLLTVFASTIRGSEGKVVGSACLLRDITAERRLRDRLLRLSTTDGLTRLFNRRHLDQVLQKEFSRAQRYRMPLSILMFDVDHFKRFNDENGHERGDQVLQAIADRMREAVRKIDIPCRYGGEEFMIILPNTPIDGASDVAERLRMAVESMDLDGLKTTISIGIAEIPTLSVRGSDEFVAAADNALYAAKNGGRNQVRRAVTTPVEQV